MCISFFFQAEDGIRDHCVTGVQTCALPIFTPEALHTLLASNHGTLLFDVRQPLDLLGHSAIIPGAKWIPPQELLKNPSLIPQEKDSVVYCTCPGDKTSRAVLHQAQAMHFLRVKFLKGGLAAWKAKGYPVEPYNQPFHLDSAT